MIDAYPLAWPNGRPRTLTGWRENSRFETTFARARDDCYAEVQRLVGKHMTPDTVISTNLPLRQDGIPLAGRRTPDDPGVAVYFTYKKRPMSFACDRWTKIEDNMQAIAKTIEALRGITRWGSGDMLEAAFTGFAALPAPGQTTFGWRQILELEPNESRMHLVEWAYKRLRSEAHPDRVGGNAERFNAVQRAWEQAQQELR